MRRALIRSMSSVAVARWSNKLEFIEPSQAAPSPVYRLLSQEGELIGKPDASLTDEKVVHLYRSMVKLNCFDNIMFESHRQGRVSFYMTNFGEEAAQLGSGGALESEDWIYAQYRETGVILEREADLDLLLSQCFGTKLDPAKGRQMPVHYGSKKLNFVTISSPLATQMPQATGHAYALKLQNTKTMVICYFGEGAASEGDAHAAMNFAATLRCPVLFFCRNNGYAISTPANEQYCGEGIAARGHGYGMAAIRVDGNDLFAVYSATKAARNICVSENRPVLIEALTYRLGHHSTSDDSAAYRNAAEVEERKREDNPLTRINKYLKTKNLWSDSEESDFRDQIRAQVLEALNRNEKVLKPPVLTIFEDVYHELPAHLIRQRAELEEHLKSQHGSHYPIDQHSGL